MGLTRRGAHLSNHRRVIPRFSEHAATPAHGTDVIDDTSRTGWGGTEAEESDVPELSSIAPGERGSLWVLEAGTIGGGALLLYDGGPPDEQWQERALCAQTDPEAFFPEKGGSTREAKRICTGCEVRDECLEYALANDERFGIWGGMSERERRRVKRGAWGVEAV